jgi:hypothetical protein
MALPPDLANALYERQTGKDADTFQLNAIRKLSLEAAKEWEASTIQPLAYDVPQVLRLHALQQGIPKEELGGVFRVLVTKPRKLPFTATPREMKNLQILVSLMNGWGTLPARTHTASLVSDTEALTRTLKIGALWVGRTFTVEAVKGYAHSLNTHATKLGMDRDDFELEVQDWFRFRPEHISNGHFLGDLLVYLGLWRL